DADTADTAVTDTTDTNADTAVAFELPPLSPFLVVDQLGYRPGDAKIAIARAPAVGFDAGTGPADLAAAYVLADALTGAPVKTLTPVAWKAGAVDASSGDRVWHLDFSDVTAPGTYVVLADGAARSPVFRVADDVYAVALRAALRTFFYQRAGFAKTAAYAGPAWADGASHLGPGQDGEARRFLARGDASTARDLHGGWYDAGDFNRYTGWHAGYIVDLLHAYRAAPAAFGDDLGIPESGNGRSDLLDEVRFGLDWLARMQEPDGGVLSVLGVAHASPPSAATGPSSWGDASASATSRAAAAFAFAATVFADAGEGDYAAALTVRAEDAWAWVAAHPSVTFFNNDGAHGTAGLAAGQQELDAYGRRMARLEAAVYLFERTGDAAYRDAVVADLGQTHLVAWGFAYPFEHRLERTLLHFAALPGAPAAAASQIRAAYRGSVDGADANRPAHPADLAQSADPYLAHLADYTWGSNGVKARQGLIFVDRAADDPAAADVAALGLRYLHYLHGVNPLGVCYLTAMGDAGVERSVDELYHGWFGDGTPWDAPRDGGQWGPPPGFLVGGPNPSYGLDGCCPSGCGSPENDALCVLRAPPSGQPEQKSFLAWNTSWPQNSWEVTENSNGYETAYIELLARFVAAP
ncbi:MAG: glycoside hydrolase family 9 protein, partial [Myxococcales bacterium]|nr:glycoside hydrolase family 9 protein [Myxococcales bacterium]